MKKIIGIIFIKLLIAGICLGQVTPEWVKFYNASGNSQDFGYSLVTDNKNNVIVSGTCQTQSSMEDFITIKYAPDGALLWFKRYTDSAFSQETCFINTIDYKNNIYAGGIATDFNGRNYAIVKYDESGNVKWVNKIFISSSQSGYLNSIVTDNRLNVYYAASTPGIGTELVKIDSNGITQWRKSFYGSGYGPAICVFDSLSNSIVVCSSLSNPGSMKITKFSENGDSLWSNIYNNSILGDVCIINSNVYVTANNGSSIITLKYNTAGNLIWNQTYNQFFNTNIPQSIVPAGTNYIYVGGTVRNVDDDFLILKYSTEGSLVWDRIFNSGSNDGLYDICINEDNNIYASGISDNGCSTVKFSSDGNYMWDHIYKIKPNETSWGFSNGVTNNNLYVTGYGIGNGSGCDIITIKYNTLIGIQTISNEIPKEFSLSQNYPNPFNPTTNIEFSLPKSGFVNITIYDAMGRKIETLVNQNLTHGTYKADWDAAKYPSGVYFYKLTAREFSETRKMVLIK